VFVEVDCIAEGTVCRALPRVLVMESKYIVALLDKKFPTTRVLAVMIVIIVLLLSSMTLVLLDRIVVIRLYQGTHIIVLVVEKRLIVVKMENHLIRQTYANKKYK
jgi:hypothetical protein